MRVAMVAGEASGDLLAAHLMGAIKRRVPSAEFVGIGGSKMEAGGFTAWWPAETLAVMGYVDALKRYWELSGIRRALLKRLLADRPDVFVAVDAPDFNLWLEKKLRVAGIPTIHYVSPSIWAWRGSRIKSIKEAADHVLCLFPFEPALYAHSRVPASFVGHPLADEIPLQSPSSVARDALQLPQDAQIVAMLPGSREGEVARLATSFVGAARILHARHPEMLFVVPMVTASTRDIFMRLAHEAGGSDLPIRVVFGHSLEAMAAANVVLVASGTASLEAALINRPMVIAYRLAGLSFWIMKRLAYLPWVGLPNILARETLVPELIQDAATPEALAESVEKWLENPDACSRLSQRFHDMHLSLRQNTAEKAAEVVLSIAGASV